LTEAKAPDITALLLRWRDADAQNQLFDLIYPILRRLAAAKLRRERSGHTLQPTALVNEAFLQITRTTSIDWQSRTQFLAIASEAMRRILVDHARNRLARKRGAGARRADVDLWTISTHDPFDEIVAIDDLMADLESRNKRVAEVFKLRYFGGLNFEEVAEILGISSKTAKRDWKLAKGWLFLSLKQGKYNDPAASVSD
jgi:RNA polymerase sigma factor (TIGR02999 family)